MTVLDVEQAPVATVVALQEVSAIAVPIVDAPAMAAHDDRSKGDDGDIDAVVGDAE